MANDEDMIEVGDEKENEIDIELKDEDVNPNIVDQLDATPGAGSDEPEPEPEPKPVVEAEAEVEAKAEEDVETEEQYSKRVKKRIEKMTFQLREAERREQAAIEYAQGIQSENVQLKTKQEHQDGVFIGEHKGRLEAELEKAKNNYKEAYASGDVDLIAEANTLLARTSTELHQAEQTESRFKRHVTTKPKPADEYVQYDPRKTEAARPQQSAPAPVDEKAEEWAGKNEWFGEDRELTDAALSIHKQLVMQEGYLPTSNAYYQELDSRMVKNFPDKKPFARGAKPALAAEQVVTPGGNGGTVPARRPGSRTIKLSASQVAIAKKLGVPLEEYAKYV